MNRQMKRQMQRQGQLGPDGEPAVARPDKGRPAPKPPSQRTKPVQFVREVRGELRRVAWPTRGEVISYSTIVLVTLIILVTLIFFLDLAFAKSVLYLFET